MTRVELSRAAWRKSSRCAGSGASDQCVEVAALGDDRIAVRDSKHPDGATLLLTHAQMTTWISGVKASDLALTALEP
jgi:Domain of unknown function (DUF397)